MFKNLVAAFCVALCIGGPMPAPADQPLQQAVELWLKGDDERSLPMLAELAADGEVYARLLLSRIEAFDLGPSPFRQALGRENSRKLFRYDDNSAFGRSWIFVEAQAGNQLAQALLKAKTADPDPELITYLNELGEHQATDRPTRIVALYGDQEMRDRLVGQGGVMDDLRPYLAYLSGTPEHRGDGLAALRHIQPEPVDASQDQAQGMAGMLALGLGYGDVSPDNVWRPAVENWLMSADPTRPIAGLCRAQCPDEARACAFAFLAVSGGYFEAIRIDSPLETVIAQDRFLNSPRARLMVLRRAALARTEANLEWLADSPQLAEISTCAARIIQAERRKYR